MEQGRIVERGTHEELYALRGRYYDLYTRQHGVERICFSRPARGIPLSRRDGESQLDAAAAAASSSADALSVLQRRGALGHGASSDDAHTHGRPAIRSGRCFAVITAWAKPDSRG